MEYELPLFHQNLVSLIKVFKSEILTTWVLNKQLRKLLQILNERIWCLKYPAIFYSRRRIYGLWCLTYGAQVPLAFFCSFKTVFFFFYDLPFFTFYYTEYWLGGR